MHLGSKLASCISLKHQEKLTPSVPKMLVVTPLHQRQRNLYLKPNGQCWIVHAGNSTLGLHQLNVRTKITIKTNFNLLSHYSAATSTPLVVLPLCTDTPHCSATITTDHLLLRDLSSKFSILHECTSINFYMHTCNLDFSSNVETVSSTEKSVSVSYSWFKVYDSILVCRSNLIIG